MNDIISNIQSEFIKESINSPILLSDLANMEKYISESYTGRSLIELLQNADDAQASIFSVEKINDTTFVVANNGRVFDENDLIALCRSGNSTKQRKGNTIGFRGIGFKSVVNYANQVHLISGMYNISFSKERTREILKTDTNVPLIRIPHQFISNSYDNVIKHYKDNGFNTIFIFETENSIIEQEIKEFSKSCMLFLNNICNIIFNIEHRQEITLTRKNISNNICLINLIDNGNSNSWLVYSNNTKSSVAFKYENGHCVPCDEEDGVIHSFMPTKDKFSALFKVNGDFTTDPSRTKIVVDNESIKSAEEVANVVLNIVKTIWEKEADDKNLIELLSTLKINPLTSVLGESISDIIVKYIKSKVKKYISQEKELYIQPKSISNEDFKLIVEELNINGVHNNIGIKGLHSFLLSMGFNELPLELCLKAMKTVKCSKSSRAQIISEVIKKTRYGMAHELIDLVKSAQILEFETGLKFINDINNTDKIDKDFSEDIISKLDSITDYNNFLKKLSLNSSLLTEKSTLHLNTIEQIETKTFSKTNVIAKWRSVETNVAGVLEKMENIEKVIDVSEQNLGYDLEVLLNNGSKEYYEVKSVNGLGDSFSLTNNEFTTAVTYKDKYYLAIVNQTNDKLSICFIKDPLNNLEFVKRATKWEWLCSEYKGKVLEFPIN